MGTKIEIDLEDLGWRYDEDGESGYRTTIQDLVVEQLAARLLHEDSFKREVQARVKEIIDVEAASQVREAVTEVLAGPIQRSTSWGERVGEPTTVKEIIREKVEAFMSTTNRSNSYDRTPSNLASLLEVQVRDALTRDLLETVKAAKATVHERVTEAALRAAVAQLSK